MSAFRFSSIAVDPQSLREQLADPTAGGFAAFEGWVRNHNEGHAVVRLEYEAFEALASLEAERIITEATARFGIVRAACVHRVGTLAIGELAVWVGVSARHRAEAFAACRYIIDELKHRVPIWKKEHYVNGDSGWVNCERCAAAAHAPDPEHHEPGHREHPHHGHRHGTEPHAAHSSSDYSRQMQLREVGATGQAKLQAAKVLVVGAGGLGVPVSSYLAGAGVGTLGILESDVLEASNLHRQTLYQLDDVGTPKANLITAALTRLNPNIVIEARPERLTVANAAGLIAPYDLIIDCSDNFTTKFALNDAAVRAGKPVIFASIYQYEGQLQVYRPESESACLRCLWPEATRDGTVGNCAEAGVLGPVPGVLGSLQALEALKILLDLPGQLRGAMLLVDLLSLEQRRITAQRRTECVHGASMPERAHATSPELEVSLEALTANVRTAYVVVDVREPQEIADAPLLPQASVQIPLASLLSDHSALDPRHRYLVVCARGARSRTAAEHLREHGFAQVYSLRGGVLGLRAAASPATHSN
jgi:sulfur-carrier protein adenylyltransferase/sulfurtransferase